MMPSAPYLRHLLVLYLKMGLNIRRAYVTPRHIMEIIDTNDGDLFLRMATTFIKRNADGDFFSVAAGVKNYGAVMS